MGTKFWLKSIKGGDNLENQVVDVRIILKWFLLKLNMWAWIVFI